MAAPRRAADERYAGESYPPRGDGQFGRDDYDSWDGGGSDDGFLPGFDEDDGGGRGGRGGRGGDWDGRDARRPRRGPVRRLAPWIALLAIVGLLGSGGYYAYSRYQSKYHPADYAGPGSGPTVTVQVKAGDSASSLGPELASLGVIASARSLVLAAESNANTAGLEPGFYKLNRHMKASLAYAELLNPKNRVQATFTLREGQRAAQIIASLSSLMHVPVSQFENIVNHPSQLGLPSYAVSSVPGVGSKVIGYKVEGFLWPATYSIQPNETPLQVMRAMVAQYNQVARQHNFAVEARQRGLSVYQLLIEASIVQAEAGNAAQMPKIARVIENRFNVPMALQFDSILEYGQNTFSVNIQNAQSSIPGPYNDFQHTGLPPTPISNPGLDAINGVLHPANGNWLFFLAQPNGSSLFCHNQPSSATATSCPAGG